MPMVELDDEIVRAWDFPMLQLGTIVIVICALVALLAMARLITNWFADR